MATPATRTVAMVHFPFSDLSDAKLRPAVILAQANRSDWVLCQITSKPYADSDAVEIADDDFQSGTLKLTSYARPGKLFTAHESLIVTEEGTLQPEVFEKIVNAVVRLIQSSLQP